MDWPLMAFHNIKFKEQHLPMRDLPYEGRLFKDVFDGIHARKQPHGEVEHILP